MRQYRNNTVGNLSFEIRNSVLNLYETNYLLIERDINKYYDYIVESLSKPSQFLLKSHIKMDLIIKK